MDAIKLENFPSYTYEDYKQWEGSWELINGLPYAMAPSPVKIHQKLIISITSEFLTKTQNCNECEVLLEEDWKIDEKNVVRPDVSIVCNDSNPNFIAKTPKIIFEVISPSTALQDENIKYQIYEKEGVKYYVLIYPETLIGKIFKNENFKYIKLGEFDKEDFIFDIDICQIKISFDEIFKRFRQEAVF